MLNGNGGRTTIDWKTECSWCGKYLTPRVVYEHKVLGCPYQWTEKRRQERVTKKKVLVLLKQKDPITVEK